MSKIYTELLQQWLQTSELPEVEEALEGVRLAPVESSNLAAVGYDKDKEELLIAFLDGSVYRFYDVPVSEFSALMSAPSHGEYFYWNIRTSYNYERIAG